MRKADEDFVSGRENIEQKYGSLENAFNAGYEEAYQYAGYNKTLRCCCRTAEHSPSVRILVTVTAACWISLVSIRLIMILCLCCVRSRKNTAESENVFQSNDAGYARTRNRR